MCIDLHLCWQESFLHEHFVLPSEVPSLSQPGRIAATQRACEVFSMEKAACLPRNISIAIILVKLYLLEVIFTELPHVTLHIRTRACTHTYAHTHTHARTHTHTHTHTLAQLCSIGYAVFTVSKHYSIHIHWRWHYCEWGVTTVYIRSQNTKITTHKQLDKWTSEESTKNMDPTPHSITGPTMAAYTAAHTYSYNQDLCST